MNPQGGDRPPDQATRVSVDVLVGQQIGDYRVLERINQGGMGVLYRGAHAVSGKPVAIKVLLPEVAADPNLVGRLIGEAHAASAIRHPNIIDIFALGQLPDGRHFLVMELLEGQSLAELIKEHSRLEPGEVQQVLVQALGALRAAHAGGVIHRDLKPENIFITRRPEGWHLTLLDFGLAKQQGTMSQVTAPNLMLGTPGFMAPEQIRGLEPTSAIDIYAMGIVGWVLLAGSEPYAGGSMVEVMTRQLEAPVPSVRTRVPAVSVALDGLLAKMMAKDPASRPSANEALEILANPFIDSVQKTEGVPALATQPTLPEMKAIVEPPPLRKAPLIIAAVGLAFLGGAVGFVFFSPPAPPPPVPRPVVTVTAPVPDPIVVVDPPRPRPVSRAEVERSLASTRAKVRSLGRGPLRRAVLTKLGRLDGRLKRNEAPAVIAKDLDKLLNDYGLK